MRWLGSRRAGEAGADGESYLAGHERVRGGGEGLAGAKYKRRARQVRLGRELSGKLRAVAARHGVTESTFLQVCWAVVLQSERGSRDVVFGNVISGRAPE